MFMKYVIHLANIFGESQEVCRSMIFGALFVVPWVFLFSSLGTLVLNCLESCFTCYWDSGEVERRNKGCQNPYSWPCCRLDLISDLANSKEVAVEVTGFLDKGPTIS